MCFIRKRGRRRLNFIMDLVYVSYNSSKWIQACFQSVVQSVYNLKDIYIYVLDNNSSDDTVEKLYQCKKQYQEKLGGFEVIPSKTNWGFGKGNNIAFAKGKSDIVCFFNIDTELCSDTLQQLSNAVKNSDSSVAMWELRQFPYEHPKLYNPVTMEAAWSSGAAFAIRRNIFVQLNGFDEHIFMYAEDVDLSWRLRSFGYHIQYVPEAIIYHYSYKEAGEIKPIQYVNSIINNLLLRYRFGGRNDVFDGHKLFWKVILKQEPAFKNSRRLLLKKYFGHFIEIPHFRNKKVKGKAKDFSPMFVGFDYTTNRDGAFYVNERPSELPLVSVIVRTCGRPDILRETLLSLRNQTYKNIEIVVVEDGAPISKKMIENEFSDLRILYHASTEKVGRSRAGNIAMTMAHGVYFNFLDDDDVFLADHVEVLVHALQKTKAKAAYTFAFATPIIVKGRSPYSYEIKDYLGLHRHEFGRVELFHHNCLPIQSVMFDRDLYKENGGFDEKLDALEDWDLWVRFSLHTNFICIPKTTSLYRIPFDEKTNERRQKELDEALVIVRDKHKNYIPTLSVCDIAMIYR